MASIMISLIDDRHRIETELSPRELSAIGFVTVSWAQLEHLMLQKTVELSDAANIEIPKDATALSFKKRIRALRALAKSALPDKDDLNKFLKILNRIGSIERSRNRITHGLWDWSPADPDKLKSSSFRPPYQFEEPFDHAKLIKLALYIGEVNFLLAYPGGEEQAQEAITEHMMQSGGHVSRLGMQLLTGKDISDHHPHLASLLKHK